MTPLTDQLANALRELAQYEGHHVWCGHANDDTKPCVCGLLDKHTKARAALAAYEARPVEPVAWQGIESCETWRFDHVNTMLAYWASRGVCETYWDIDEDFDDRPKGWVSPREGWRCPGDMCIPVNQGDVTHWMPLPAPPRGEA